MNCSCMIVENVCLQNDPVGRTGMNMRPIGAFPC